MNVRIGTAPDSWGVWFPQDDRQTPPARFLDEVREAGYEWIELGPFGYLPKEAAALRNELDLRGLKVTASGVMGHIEDPDDLARMERDTLALGPVLQELSAPYFLLIDDTFTDIFSGEIIRDPVLARPEWDRLIEGTNHLGRLVMERFGLQLVFHPHAQTHVETEEQITSLLAQTDPRYVNLCLDTGHHSYAGGDPIEFFRAHSERIPYLHVKSVDGVKQQTVFRDGIPFARAVEMGVFTEPSEGVVDFREFKRALEEVNYDGWAMVEQDMFPTAFDKPLPIARRSLQYLREIGLG
jgi:inosose dehydratase